ncbi:16S rRNA (guanine(966)-N(2))-methyltransferase RsmD [uncultured Parolsenella sp.]|uniref:16S rRNA (guanine(966)-N(2))-methyltransferase RsmD n=2 Tax=uncultured Parolsenella sp. TaxID=2083008 RepID=UPI0025DEFD04|nr:16S rRNA (guanine(966)-N(2))-methyltransferase RsmD [uncultured Parolsenella sp.]
MRIVGGKWKGHPIEAPDGRDVTRPTTDRVREAVSSMLLSARGLSLDDVRALDAFAGSGALGLELLSRGAAHVTFVDLDRGACARVRRNAGTLGAAPATFAVVRGDSCRLAAAGSLAGAPFDIVLLDPPYATEVDVVAGLVEALDCSGLLASDAIVLYERSASRPTIEPAGFVPLKQKRYGQTAVDLLGRES